MFEEKAQKISDALWQFKYKQTEVEKFRQYVEFANSDKCSSASLSFGLNTLDKDGDEKNAYVWTNVALDAHKEVIIGMLETQLAFEEKKLKEKESALKSLIGGS
jgi:hypothetical protein